MYELPNSLIGNLAAMTQVNVVEVLAKLGDGVNSDIGDIAALGQYQVAQPWSNINNLFNGGIGKACAGCQVKNSKMFIGSHSLVRKAQKCTVVDELAAGKSQLS